jgi:hypothetical protein
MVSPRGDAIDSLGLRNLRFGWVRRGEERRGLYIDVVEVSGEEMYLSQILRA